MQEIDRRTRNYPTAPIDSPYYGDLYFDTSCMELMKFTGKEWTPMSGVAKSVWAGMHFERIDKRKFSFHDNDWIALVDFKLEEVGIVNFRRIINPQARFTRESARWIYIFDDTVDLAMFMVMFGNYISQTTYNLEKK